MRNAPAALSCVYVCVWSIFTIHVCDIVISIHIYYILFKTYTHYTHSSGHIHIWKFLSYYVQVCMAGDITTPIIITTTLMTTYIRAYTTFIQYADTRHAYTSSITVYMYNIHANKHLRHNQFSSTTLHNVSNTHTPARKLTLICAC